MRKYLKTLSFLLCAAILFSLVSCSGGKGTETSKKDETTKEVTTDNPATSTNEISTTEESTTEETTTIDLSKLSVSERIDLMKLKTQEDIKRIREYAFEEYLDKIRKTESARRTELVSGKITIGNITMRIETKIDGSPSDNGKYPIYIILHGGGADPTGQINDSQWKGMIDRYRDPTTYNGIFVSCRAIENTWDCHWVPNAFQFYDRIIEDAVAFMKGDPNRVYLVGYSAGGDGVYQISPRLADRFAAVNMSAGHPNGVSLASLYNLPIYLQVGELDKAYSRNTVTVEYGNKLLGYQKTYKGGYTHEVFVHVNKEHGVVGDNAKNPQTVVDNIARWFALGGKQGEGGTKTAITHAAALMSQHTRNPLPEKVVWDLSARAAVRKTTAFYWLDVDISVNNGVIVAEYDKANNKITISKCDVKNKDITILLNEEMVDLFKPVTLVVLNKETTYELQLDKELLRRHTDERGDPNYQFIAKITFRVN